jgi:hypothetical protein
MTSKCNLNKKFKILIYSTVLSLCYKQFYEEIIDFYAILNWVGADIDQI